MTVINSRESMLSHENYDYINSRPNWVFGKIPDLSDYRKLSVDNFEEAFALARYGQSATSEFIPTYRNRPLLLSFTQALLVGAALLSREQADKLGLEFEKYRSVLMVTTTRFGKSFLNGIVAIIKAGVEGKEVRIGGASIDKAGIIQEKVISLLSGTCREVQDGLIVSRDNDTVNKKILRMTTQVSKEALVWSNGGSIKLFSTNESQKNASVAAAGAIGVGGDFAILDEIQLMTPIGFRTASRFMMENPDTKRFCVGNPQINGHFRDLYDDPDTFVVHLNDIGAIVEGRTTRRAIELTGMPTYSAEYRAFCEVEFPDDKKGNKFYPTLPMPASSASKPAGGQKTYFMGIDSAYKGGDALMVTIVSYNQNDEGKHWFEVERSFNLKEKYPEWVDDTTLNMALDIVKLVQQYDIQNICIDIGFGIHIYEAIKRLAEGANVEPVNFSERPTEWRQGSDYNAQIASNARAEMNLDLRDICENNLLYVCENIYDELCREMREVGSSSTTSANKIRIEGKKEIKKRLGRSPDILDSICLAVRAAVLSGELSTPEEIDSMELAEFF